MEGKFKVGDRVIVNGRYEGLTIDNRRGRVLYTKQTSTILIEFDESFSNRLHTGSGKGKWGLCWWINPNCPSVEIKLDSEKETIVIYRKGNEVIALDKANNKKAVALCNPEDTFDFETGARLAFERLFEKQKYNGRVVCVHANTSRFTKGKIYDVINGVVRDDYGEEYRFEDINSFNEYMTSEFIEIKED